MFLSWKIDVHTDRQTDQGKISQHIKPLKKWYLKQEQLGQYWNQSEQIVSMTSYDYSQLTQNITGVCPIYSAACISEWRYICNCWPSRLGNNTVHWSCTWVSTVNSSHLRTLHGFWNLNKEHNITFTRSTF